MQLVRFRGYALGAAASLFMLALLAPGFSAGSYADTPTPSQGPQYPFVTPTPTPEIEWLVATPITPRPMPAELPDTGGDAGDYNKYMVYGNIAAGAALIFAGTRLLDSYGNR